MTLSDKDWEQLSAYADGELDPAARAALEDRLAREPALADALEQLDGLKSSLAELRPAPGRVAATPVSPPARRWGRILVPAALAAGLALFILPLTLPDDGEWKSAVAWHEDFAAREVALDSTTGILPASLNADMEAKAPDLTPSGLQLVAVETAGVGDKRHLAAHYRGLRGCRLTLHATDLGDDPAADVPGHFMLHRWQTGGLRYTLLARGMDQARFEAIARFSEHRTRSQGGAGDLQLAMETTSAAAPPCA